ncbi:hypothetical protein A165_09765 [Vibrio tasmaniensis ZS-17]|nr:hypothetical protein A165_09765 [Vibrio tasmaniensis ZS-17]
MRYSSRRYKQKLTRLYTIARQNDLPLPFVINCIRAKSELKKSKPYEHRTMRLTEYEETFDRFIVKQR